MLFLRLHYLRNHLKKRYILIKIKRSNRKIKNKYKYLFRKFLQCNVNECYNFPVLLTHNYSFLYKVICICLDYYLSLNFYEHSPFVQIIFTTETFSSESTPLITSNGQLHQINDQILLSN